MSTTSIKLYLFIGLVLFGVNIIYLPLGIKNDQVSFHFYNNLKNFFSHTQQLDESEIEMFNLQLRTNDERKLRSWKLLSDSKDVDRKSFKSILCSGHECTTVQVKSKGDLKRHWETKRKSYRFRLEDHSFLKADKIDFTLAQDRYFENEVLANVLAQKFNMPILPISFSLLSINNSHQTLYIKSLRYSKINLEKYLHEYSHIVRMKNIWLPHLEQSNIGTFYYSFKEGQYHYNHWRNYKQTYSIEPERKTFDVDIRWDLAISCIRTQCKEMKKYFNMDHFSKWVALISLFGSYHATLGDNLFFIYNSSTKLFSPVINDVLIRKSGEYEVWLNKVSEGNDFIKNFLIQNNSRKILKEAIKKLVKLQPLNERLKILNKSKKDFYKTNVYRDSIDKSLSIRRDIIHANLESIKAYK